MNQETIERAARAGYLAYNERTTGFDAAAAWEDMGGSEPSYEVGEWHEVARAVIAAIHPTVSSVEYGITYRTNSGDLRTEWGYSHRPELDADGESQIGKREFVYVYEILARPRSEETSIWQSADCPWKDET